MVGRETIFVIVSASSCLRGKLFTKTRNTQENQ
jgi:hypothetical protein